MMKIHTTQNLSSMVGEKSTNNIAIPKETRLKRQSSVNFYGGYKSDLMYSDSLTFKGKKPTSKDVKKVVETAKKVVGDIKKDAQPEVKKGDKFLNSPLFNKLLKVAEYETVVQAAIAAAVCIALRPLTIMALPAKGKTKEDNIYASAHSIASGTVGLITVFALTTPFKNGANYVMKHMKQNLKESTLKRLHPQLNKESIVDAAGKRKPMEEWLDYQGNKFTGEIKDCQKLPEFKQLADVSEETFKKVLGVNIDFASQKGKSFNKLLTKDGKSLYDTIDFSKLGIKVKEEGSADAQILLKDLNKDYLEKLITDSKGINEWGNLDIKSVYNNKEVVDFRKWKDINGKDWKLDLDSISVSSALETANYRPRITGEKLKNGKFATYQKNEGIGDNLGTKINEEMLEAEKNNVGLIKALTWLPDLSFRIPIAVGTIALIPWVLKNVFHMEKKPKKAPEQLQIQQAQTKPDSVVDNNKTKEDITFKGKGDPSWFSKKMGEWYGKPLIESEKMGKASAWLAKLPGSATQHMATLGSLITSSVYVQQTITNKDMDPERRRTLAINQGLCFVVPTAAAYTVDHFINDWVKKQEYRYSGLQEQKAAVAKYNGEDVGKITKSLGDRLKGVRILASLATFTLIYRYATPVIITPIANWLGDLINKKKESQVVDLDTQNKTKSAA